MRAADVIIIGAGIAGASLAWRLSGRGLMVLLLDMESRAGFHSTGRSAAMYEPRFGPPVIRSLTVASGDFFINPPEGFSEVPLSSPRGTLMACEAGDEALMAEGLALGFRQISHDDARTLLPVLKTDCLIGCLHDADTRDLDVDALHQACLKAHRQAGGGFIADAELLRADRREGVWHIETSAGEIESPLLVNAAGAWADVVANRCGIEPLGLVPKRRSMAVVTAPEGAAGWPQIFPAREDFYAKPQGQSLLVSPADADAVAPHDAWADDIRIAEGIEAFGRLMDVEITHVQSTWGGLRTFAPDGDPVVGFDSSRKGFFWLAGQGGYGIQTAPALSETAARVLLGADEDMRLTPARLRS